MAVKLNINFLYFHKLVNGRYYPVTIRDLPENMRMISAGVN